MNKFEKLIDLIINEDETKAKKLFHTIVVENSRKIYEGLIDEEDLAESDDDEDGDDIEDMVDDVEADEEGIEESNSLRGKISVAEAKQLLDYMDGTLNEADTLPLLKKVARVLHITTMEGMMPGLEEAGDEILDVAYGDEEGMDDMGDEPMGDEPMGDEMGMDDMGDEPMGDEMGMDDMGGEDAGMEDRVVDLEDAIDELKAEFDQMIAGEEGGEEDMDMDMDAEGGEEDFGGEEGEEEVAADEEGMEEGEEEMEESLIREYVDKVSAPSNSEGEGTNKKSTVAGKNDMGGSAANILGGNTDEKGMKAKGPSNLPGAGNFENDPKAKAGKTWKNAKKPASKESGADKKSLLDGPKGK